MRLTILIISFVAFLTASIDGLPIETSDLFSASGNCEMCHRGAGDVLTIEGEDVSPIRQWQSSMMAHSAKDPVWRAVVAHEISEFPEQQAFIEDRCTTCHAPMGRTQAQADGQESYSIEAMSSSHLARDGVSCTLCHQITATNLGQPESYSGGYQIGKARQIFGPYVDPFPMPMINHTGFEPVFSAHVHEAALCGTCHTLFTPTLDESGQIVGEFAEQTPYLEWLNSAYPAAEKTCQSCHMPRVETPVDIALMPPWHDTQRQPYWQHEFVGGNVMMLELLRDNAMYLGSEASPAHFDWTIERTRNMLQHQTVSLATDFRREADQLEISVQVKNLAGHKLPTGIPLRRMWLHVTVRAADGTPLFESGDWNDGGQISGLDEPFEPHHELIQHSDQVQVYEAIMQDAAGAVTQTLLRGAAYAKDNRIPPRGFQADHDLYGTIAVAGQATTDDNFNQNASGADEVVYQVAADPDQACQVTIELCYQSVRPEYVTHLKAVDARRISIFADLYDTTGNTPTVLKQVAFEVPASE